MRGIKDFKGVVIEESLEDKAVLKELNIVATKVEKVSEKHKTPWLSEWALHTIKVPAAEATWIAKLLSGALEKSTHGTQISKTTPIISLHSISR